jgi:homoserine kinase
MISVLAPATTANLGPGFDAVGVALDLWNELQAEESESFAVDVLGEGAGEVPLDRSHLALRAFELFAPPERFRFTLRNRIPLERGLGSSAATIALGLVAGAAAAGRDTDHQSLLEAGAPLEGHVDNLAAAVCGGACIAWNRNGAPHATRVASGLPFVPVVVIPETRTNTAASRAGLPASVSHGDAAVTAGAAAMLGAALASGDAALLREAFHDRLHEPYRLENAPLLGVLRANLPDGAAGVTLSGSGPSVVVWAEPGRVADVVSGVAALIPESAQVLPLTVADRGAHLA